MVVYLSKVVGTVVLALGLAALGVIASTDAYSVGAGTEVSSYKALHHIMGSGGTLLCMNEASQTVQQ